ncbi:MAG TPA: magnesium-translocating P-type ATPase, partial [Candidatus Lokiarchaeia archaeon]
MIEKNLPYWSKTSSEILKILETTELGLTSQDAENRIDKFGANKLKPKKKRGKIRLFLAQFKNPIILILLSTAILSFVLQDAIDGLIIIIILFISSFLGFWQEMNATIAIEKLLSIVNIKIKVLRNGIEQEINVEDIVPGDIILFSAGEIIPADSILLESKNLFVNEATLTGETYPVEKNPEPTSANDPLGKRTNVLFMGTSVISGTAKAVVVYTGKETEFGKISEKLEHKAPQTEFEHGLKRFGYLLSNLTLLFVIFIFAINIFLSRPFLDSFTFALALAIGLTPQLLPAIISINLSRGAKRLADQKVIVKKLNSIENFGSMNVLCSDKTGTITQGIMELYSAVDINGKENEKVLTFAYINSFYELGYVNPIDQAIRESNKVKIEGYQKLDELPFDFIRKRLSVLVQKENDIVLISKGAVPNILNACSFVELSNNEIDPLSRNMNQIQNYFKELSDKGFRILGVSYKKMDSNIHITNDNETDMTFLGFIVLHDPLKPGISRTIQELYRLGVNFKMITGDNKFVASYAGQQIGLKNTKVVTGTMIREMSDEALTKYVNETDIFAEVEPNQKERIILSLKKSGNIVGYLGDGINDSTALHAADVGISVDNAVDVAKEAAAIVLLEKDLNILIEGVKEGRRTFANTIKYIFITTSANFGNMFSMAGASLFLPILPMLPKQILLTNLLTDIPAIAISTDNVDENLMERPRRWNIKFIYQFMIVFGIISSVFDYLTFIVLLYVLNVTPEVFQTSWFFISVGTELIILLVMRTQKVFFKSKPSKYLLINTLLMFGIVFVMIYIPFGNILGFTPLSIELL